MKYLPRINSDMVRDSEINETERTILFLIRNVQDMELYIKAAEDLDKSRVKHVKILEQQIILLKNQVKL